MSCIFQKLFQDIKEPYFETGSVDTGVTPYELFGKDIFIDDEMDLPFLVIHQSQDAGASGSRIEELLHKFRLREIWSSLDKSFVTKRLSPGMSRR